MIEIPITQLPATTVLNENHLAEITDSTVISRLSALAPFASQTATRQVANKATKALQGAELVKLDRQGVIRPAFVLFAVCGGMGQFH